MLAPMIPPVDNDEELDPSAAAVEVGLLVLVLVAVADVRVELEEVEEGEVVVPFKKTAASAGSSPTRAASRSASGQPPLQGTDEQHPMNGGTAF